MRNVLVQIKPRAGEVVILLHVLALYLVNNIVSTLSQEIQGHAFHADSNITVPAPFMFATSLCFCAIEGERAGKLQFLFYLFFISSPLSCIISYVKGLC